MAQALRAAHRRRNVVGCVPGRLIGAAQELRLWRVRGQRCALSVGGDGAARGRVAVGAYRSQRDHHQRTTRSLLIANNSSSGGRHSCGVWPCCPLRHGCCRRVIPLPPCDWWGGEGGESCSLPSGVTASMCGLLGVSTIATLQAHRPASTEASLPQTSGPFWGVLWGLGTPRTGCTPVRSPVPD